MLVNVSVSSIFNKLSTLIYHVVLKNVLEYMYICMYISYLLVQVFTRGAPTIPSAALYWTDLIFLENDALEGCSKITSAYSPLPNCRGRGKKTSISIYYPHPPPPPPPPKLRNWLKVTTAPNYYDPPDNCNLAHHPQCSTRKTIQRCMEKRYWNCNARTQWKSFWN